jgi:hypothetical protein
MHGLTIEAMHLAAPMADAARALHAACPSVIYLSGRRDLAAQAHAMACQVVTDRRWIAKTYLHAALLQTAVEYHPECVTVAQLQQLLSQTLQGMSDQERAGVSDHLSGQAVDLLPMEDAAGYPTALGQYVIDWIQACPETKTFLMREGGKVVWHWAIKPVVEV